MDFEKAKDLKMGLYQHYKNGKKYLVIGTARHSETTEALVVYLGLYENPRSTMWVRPLEMFLEEVEYERKKVKRFKYLGPSIGAVED